MYRRGSSDRTSIGLCMLLVAGCIMPQPLPPVATYEFRSRYELYEAILAASTKFEASEDDSWHAKSLSSIRDGSILFKDGFPFRLSFEEAKKVILEKYVLVNIEEHGLEYQGELICFIEIATPAYHWEEPFKLDCQAMTYAVNYHHPHDATRIFFTRKGESVEYHLQQLTSSEFSYYLTKLKAIHCQ